MKVIKSIFEMQKISNTYRQKNKTIGLVPTMGALHHAHIELIKKAKKESDIVVVSIFVNPIQFGPKEDFKKYPRPIQSDLSICQKLKVNFVFYPSTDKMYPCGDVLTKVSVTKLSDILCGKYRPGHFTGVATVVAKLFNIIKPHKAYFGEKDFQQLKIIQQMVDDLNFDIEIIPCPTIREKDGLAVSSRNVYLSEKERCIAGSLFKSLQYCSKLIKSEKYSLKQCITMSKKYLETLLAEVNHKIQYFEIYDNNLQPFPDNITKLSRGSKLRIFVACYIGETRLIDNIEVRI